MRDQYKVLAEKYDQIQEARASTIRPPAPIKSMEELIKYLAFQTQTWQNYVDIDAPYEITYRDFLEFVIKDSHANARIKNIWDTLPPKEKKRVYFKVIHLLAREHGDEEIVQYYPDPDEKKNAQAAAQAAKRLKKGSDKAGVNLDI